MAVYEPQIPDGWQLVKSFELTGGPRDPDLGIISSMYRKDGKPPKLIRRIDEEKPVIDVYQSAD